MPLFASLFRLFVREPLGELGQRPKGQVSALDALRSCAVLFVVAGHGAHEYLKMGGQDNRFASLPFIRAGWIGVDLFFVLSGYFIGRQLWRELLQTQKINLWQFALRRGYRIWPLFFFFIIAVFLWNPSRIIEGRRWSDPVFLTNYYNRGMVPGSWSLCTEEQFYLLTPLLLTLGFPWLKSVDGFRRYLAACFLLLPAVRAVAWWHLAGDVFAQDDALYSRISQPIHTHADGLLIGLFLSNLEVCTGKRWKAGFFASFWSVLLALAVGGALHKLQPQLFNYTGVTLFFAAAVWYSLSRPDGRVPLTDAWVFYLLSRLSYGMYLNHFFFQKYVFAFGMEHVPGAHQYPTAHHIVLFLMHLSLTVAAALVTFCLVEYPFLKLRERRLAPAAPRPQPLPPVLAPAELAH